MVVYQPQCTHTVVKEGVLAANSVKSMSVTEGTTHLYLHKHMQYDYINTIRL